MCRCFGGRAAEQSQQKQSRDDESRQKMGKPPPAAHRKTICHFDACVHKVTGGPVARASTRTRIRRTLAASQDR